MSDVIRIFFWEFDLPKEGADTLTTLANRLIRLDKQISDSEKTQFALQANGQTINQVVRQLLNAYDPDTIANMQLTIGNKMSEASPAELHSQLTSHHSQIIEKAINVFHNPDLRN